MNEPFFSVIIPTFNSQNTLVNCLESLVSQSYSDFEILIIDGCSNDGTITVVKTFEAKFKDLKWHSEPDLGIYDAMNKGIAKAKGKWLLFLGSDDSLHDNTVLADTANFLINNSTSVVYGNVKIAGNPSWAKDGQVYDGEFDRAKIFDRNICHQAIFYSRDVFPKIGHYNINYEICADWDFNLRCFANFSPVYFNRIISIFNGGGGSTQQTSDAFTSRDILFKIIKYFKIDYFNPELKKFGYIFMSEAVELWKNSHFITSFYFLGILLFHSNHKRDDFRTFRAGIRN